jgi:hypothetical protein
MAKLNVVIPAVEVTVDGVTYRKVDRKAQAGDIVKALKNDDDIDMGAFYAVYSDSCGDAVFADNEGDERGDYQLRSNSENYEVYAPISEPATATASDTVMFEGATWRKVDRDVNEGDAIKFTDEGRSSYLTKAELYVVCEVDSCDDPQIKDDDGDEYDAGGEDYEVYEKVAEEKAVEYREVKRKANVGEKIRVTNVHRSDEEFSEGDVLTVSRVDGAGDIWYAEEVDIDGIIFYQHREHGNEYVVLEPVTKSAEPTQPERLAVGDYARVVDFTQMYAESGVVEGSIVKITQDDESYRPFKATLTDGNNAGWFTASELVRATNEEVSAAKRAALTAQFAIGDYVKVVVGYCEHNAGDVLKIDATASMHDFYVTNAATNRLGCIDADKLVKLTAAEIAEIERKQAEEEARRREETKWSAIGRKVNEYKRGDIVAGVGVHTHKHEIGTVKDVGSTHLGVDREDNKYSAMKIDEVTLIVPVEQRFDRAEEVDAA